MADGYWSNLLEGFMQPDVIVFLLKATVAVGNGQRPAEIHYALDSDPHAACFRQDKNDMFIRMALLAAVLSKA